MWVSVRSRIPNNLVPNVMQVAVGRRLSDQGIGVTVVDPVWALPINPALVALAADHELVITIEDNGTVGGWGTRLAQELRFAGVDTALREFGRPQEFIPHGGRGELLEEVGLTPQHIARYAVGAVKQTVGLYSPIAFRRFGGVACSRSSEHAPNRIGKSSRPPSAYVNASGGDPQKRSSGDGFST